MRRFLRAIGFSCLFRDRGRGASGHQYGRYSSRPRPSSPALRAIAIEDVRYAFNQNVLGSDDGTSSVYSSQYGGNDSVVGRGRRHQQQYVLFLGTEHQTNFKPEHLRPRHHSGEYVDSRTLQPSMSNRNLPVFFTPPPPERLITATTPRKSILYNDISPPDSPNAYYA